MLNFILYECLRPVFTDSTGVRIHRTAIIYSTSNEILPVLPLQLPLGSFRVHLNCVAAEKKHAAKVRVGTADNQNRGLTQNRCWKFIRQAFSANGNSSTQQIVIKGNNMAANLPAFSSRHSGKLFAVFPRPARECVTMSVPLAGELARYKTLSS